MVSRPFFMTLPGYPGRMDEKELLSDLEYLQQTYPGEVRRCQRRIAEILDKYDYEGSMIYDCLLYTSPSPRDVEESRMPSSA